MTILATVGACMGLLVLVLMSLAPAIVALDERFPVGRRKQAQATREARAARAVKAAREATGTRITAHA
jgi:hypothetical protein